MYKRQIKLTDVSSFFLFGARGTGKTTLLHDIYKKGAYFIDLLDPEQVDLFSRNPNELRQIATALSSDIQWVVLDEIQKVPKLLDVVHQLIEELKIKFVLTGSSGRKLKRGVSNLLAGRAFISTLHPLTSIELGDDFDLSRCLSHGTLPKVWTLESDADRNSFLRSYSLTYLKEEIQEEQIVRKLDPFRHFLEVAAQSNGDIINYSKIASDVGVDTKTVMSYFSILEETLVGVLIPPFHRSIRKQQRSNPKFYFFDTGVKRALDRTLEVPLREKTFAFGNAFEHFIVIETARLSNYRYPDWRFSYLRTAAGAEIDLIIDRPGKPYLMMEIKSTDHVGEREVSVLNRFAGDFPDAEYFCISRDSVRKRIGEVLCLHWRMALKEIGLF